jgi:hypothetical protein
MINIEERALNSNRQRNPTSSETIVITSVGLIGFEICRWKPAAIAYC